MANLTSINHIPCLMHRMVEDLAQMLSSEILFMVLTNIVSASMKVNLLLRLIGLSVLMRVATVLATPTSGTVPNPMVLLTSPKDTL